MERPQPKAVSEGQFVVWKQDGETWVQLYECSTYPEVVKYLDENMKQSNAPIRVVSEFTVYATP